MIKNATTTTTEGTETMPATHTDIKVAQIIAEQLGQSSLFMMGAKNLVGGPEYLQFRIGRNSKGINMIRITLTPADLYKVEFMRVRKNKVTILTTEDEVYVDGLHHTIETATGLCLSMF